VLARDGAGNHYNVFTIGDTTNPDTALTTGIVTGIAVPAPVTDAHIFFPYVNRGCGIDASNYDGDAGSASIVDVFGAATTLAVSPNGDHVETAVVVEPAAGANQDSSNYGMFRADYDPGASTNGVDWRVADFLGWATNPPTLPRDPNNAIRMYLPNGYTVAGGAVTSVTAPFEPVLRTSIQYVSGANPPAVGQLTTYAIWAHLDNGPTAAIPQDTAIISIGVPAPATAVPGTLTAYINGNPAACSSNTQTATLMQCTFDDPIPANEPASIRFEVTLTPAVAGVFSLTGAPAGVAAPTPPNQPTPPNTTARAQYTSAFNTTEHVGPVCDLRVQTGVAVTWASLRGLRVDPLAGVVEFATGVQRGTQAFNVYGLADRRAEPVLLTSVPLAAPVADTMMPTLYRAEVGAIGFPFLMLEEIERGGARRRLGPFRVGDRHLAAAFARVQSRLESSGLAERDGGETRTFRPRVVRERRQGPRRDGGFGGRPAIAIATTEAGRVRVAWPELVAQGLPAQVAERRLSLTRQGAPVAFTVERALGQPEALVFETDALATAYSGEQVHVLSWREPAGAPSVALTSWKRPTPADNRRVERDTFFVASMPQGHDPWAWDLLFGDGGTWPYGYLEPEIGAFDLPGLPAELSGSVPVRIHVVGFSPEVHALEAWVNDQPVGQLGFGGLGAAVLEGAVPAESLRAEGNQLTIRYTSPDGVGIVYLDRVELGLPAAPVTEVAEVSVRGFDGRVSLGRVDYLVVTHPDFAAAAERLAALKAAEGFRTAVVDVERAYDRHSGGVVEARAVQALVREAAGRGARYVLLFGDDTFDPQDLSGLGLRSFVPSIYAWDGEFGRVVSENLYADVSGDGRPDVAIGRLPASTPEEADALVAKIARQDASLRAGAGRHLVALDGDQGPASFSAMAQQAAASLPAGTALTWADSGAGVEAARDVLLAGLRQGNAVTHYFGHGGPELWADEALLTTDAVEGLAGSPGETVVFAWSCQSQFYQYPLGPSLGEALTLLPQGGAVASFGPAGISDLEAQAGLQRALYARLFRPGVTLGEAIRAAKSAALAADPRTAPAVEGFNLIGDPALRLP
jgi:hypothetical protein